MATRVNPFHTGLDRGKRWTLAEIEAATNGFKAFNAVQNKPTRLPPERERVSQWLSRQPLHISQGNFIDLTGPSTPQTSCRNSGFIQDSWNESGIRRPPFQTPRSALHCSPRRSEPQTPLSFRQLPSNGVKRKAIYLDDSDEDIQEVIIVKPLLSTPRSRSRLPEVIDLTEPDRPKRIRSFLGNKDKDVIVIDPPAAEIRGSLRPLVLGRVRSSDAKQEKRPRQTHIRSTPERSTRQTAETEVTVSEADADEATDLMRNIPPVCHFFTLATEIRDKIYRYLLVSPEPIHVQHLWTELARRPTRRGRHANEDVDFAIDTRILSVCRRTALEGTRVLYSENTFLYMLRDANDVEKGNVRRSQRHANRGRQEQERRTINLAKYGHLLRHMAIELEPNRTGNEYERLMGTALETLAPASRNWAPSRPSCGPIHLHTLTITISPLFEQSQRTIRAPAVANQDAPINEGRFLSVVSFFSRGGQVLKALQKINANFLHIHLHVNSDVKNSRSGTDSPPWVEHSDESDESDSEEETSDAFSLDRSPKPKHYHLETTIDLRCLPRHLEALHREGNLPLANDPLMQEQRRRQAADAEDVLAHLRQHIEHACLWPEQALRGGVWQEHAAAERKRRERREREERRFDGDAYDRKVIEEEDGAARVVARGMKSLILSIDKVGEELRAYRA
ncbi:hypothetical protein VTI74DRAFT_7293 [Chaetomium olivicolor]